MVSSMHSLGVFFEVKETESSSWEKSPKTCSGLPGVPSILKVRLAWQGWGWGWAWGIRSQTPRSRRQGLTGNPVTRASSPVPMSQEGRHAARVLFPKVPSPSSRPSLSLSGVEVFKKARVAAAAAHA